MSTPSLSFSDVPRRRWLSLLLFVIALHLVLVYWALSPSRQKISRRSGAGQSLVTAELQAAPAPLPAALVPVERAVSAPVPTEQASSEQPPADGGGAGGDSAGGDADSAMAGMEVPGTSVEEAMPVKPSVVAKGAAGTGKQISEPVVLGVPVRYQVKPPPSAELRYQATARQKGQQIFGNGQIRWQADGKRFSVQGEFNILFMSLLNFRSEGEIDEDFGVSPVIYSEKRIRRSETNTHFQRDRNLVSFSSSTRAYRRQGGEQDRASVVWQLAGIGRHSGNKMREGAEFELVVAGVRDAEIRRVRVVALEEIETGVGKVKAWHLLHNRRPGSYEQTLDIWLAPEKDWYPVKLRYTDKSGDYIDLVLSDISKDSAH